MTTLSDALARAPNPLAAHTVSDGDGGTGWVDVPALHQEARAALWQGCERARQGHSQVFALVGRLRRELKVNTTCGASNVSFGLPERNGINAAFLTMAIGAGMTSAITNPLHEEVMRAVMGADVMMGHDPDCMRWIRKFRADPPAGADGEPGRGRREGGRRRKV